MNLLGSGKSPLAEYFADKGFWPSQPSDVMGSTAGRYLDMISTPNTGTIAGTASSYTLVATMKTSGINAFVGFRQDLELHLCDDGQQIRARELSIGAGREVRLP